MTGRCRFGLVTVLIFASAASVLGLVHFEAQREERVAAQAKVERFEQAWRLVAATPYVFKPDWTWRNPTQTLREGGDCEDKTVALLALLQDDDAQMLHVTLKDGQAHAVARVGGRILEPQQFERYYELGDFRSVDVIFTMAEIRWFTTTQSLSGQASR